MGNLRSVAEFTVIHKRRSIIMKKQSFLVIAALAFVFGIGIITASAQGPVLRAEIPFEFTVGGKVMPAGKYMVKLPDASGTQVVMFKAVDGDAHATAMTNRVDSRDAGVANGLVFIKSADRYYLYQVHSEGREIGQQVVKSGRLAGTELARKTVEFKTAKSE
jgi:hypothetical protein